MKWAFKKSVFARGFRGRETLKTVSLFSRQRRHGRVIPSSEAAELTGFSGRYSYNVLLETKVGFSQKKLFQLSNFTSLFMV